MKIAPVWQYPVRLPPTSTFLEPRMGKSELTAARDAAFAAFAAAKKGKCKKALAEAEAALKAASKALTAEKAAASASFVTPERLAEAQARAMAALRAREDAQAAERQQQRDIAAWARGDRSRVIFERLRADNVVSKSGEFSSAFLSANE